MAYWFLGIKLLLGTHHLFLGIGQMFPGTPKLFLGTFWLLRTTLPFLETLERFLNQNEQVSFSYASRLLFGKAESPRGDMDLGQHSLFSCFDVPAHLLMRGHPQSAPAASHENRSYPRLLDFATGSREYPRHPTVGCLYISHT